MASTYAGLKAEIQAYAKRSDCLSMIDTFIDFAEADMWQRLRLRDMDTRSTYTLTTRYLALPTGYQQMRKLNIVAAETYQLEPVAPESLVVRTGSGIPSYYTITSQLEFDITPNSSLTVEMQYFASLTPLSDSNTSNAVLTRFPMIYLYGAMMHFATWAQDPELFNQYALLFNGAIESANKEDRRSRRGAAPAMRIEGSTP